MRAGPLDVITLTDGGQRAGDIAHTLADWIGATRHTLDVAIYNVRVPGKLGDRLGSALRDAAARGVVVRVVAHHPDLQPPDPLQAAPPARTRPELLLRLGIQLRTIAPPRDLMHHKFAVRDGAAVWTGSANWTLADWTREENVVVGVSSPSLAAAYGRVFEELWDGGQVDGTGAFDSGVVHIGDAEVRPWFCPGRGRELSREIARRVETASRRVRIASPVITAGPILEALDGLSAEGPDAATGVVDLTQTLRVLHQWGGLGGHWKAPALERVIGGLQFGGKRSVMVNGVGDPMHAKVVVVDDTVFTGSFNLSRSGEDNAENVLEIEDPVVADRFAAYVDELRAMYPDAHAALDGAPR